MAPLELHGWTSVLVTLAIGLAFGFVLERSGFGNAKNLAAQFYLHDMRVLKVMFTAIVTAMLLVFLCSALGWLDFGKVWVPPTHLAPAVLGGLLLGVGFIIGGYCPGTSLVSMATLKIDGLFFALGVLAGLLLFGQTVPFYWEFWQQAGSAGRQTLAELVGVNAGVVVAGVTAAALCAFWVVERVERYFDPAKPAMAQPTQRRLMAASAAALAIAGAGMLIGQPDLDRRVAWREKDFDAQLAGRAMFIDPAELLGLMHNNQVPLVLVDVRTPRDYNLFHLLDARNVAVAELDDRWGQWLPPEAVVVVMSNDEGQAARAWKRLAVRGTLNAYILAGGINRWLDLFVAGLPSVPGPEVPATGADELRHRFDRVEGQSASASRPAPSAIAQRAVPAKVKSKKPTRMPGGGCG